MAVEVEHREHHLYWLVDNKEPPLLLVLEKDKHHPHLADNPLLQLRGMVLYCSRY
jgi:hypothetical protein